MLATGCRREAAGSSNSSSSAGGGSACLTGSRLRQLHLQQVIDCQACGWRQARSVPELWASCETRRVRLSLATAAVLGYTAFAPVEPVGLAL